MNKIKDIIIANKTVVFFVLLCIGGIIAAAQPMSFVLNELLTRIGRNTFLVLALLIPVQAGMGLNFAIVVGAMSAQIGIFIVLLSGVTGMPGILLCVAISVPIALVFGFLTGKLLNQMKGAEMIGGIILGFFSDGLYQFLFLFVFGGIIAINSSLMISNGIGVRNTMDLAGNMRQAIDSLWRMSLLDALTIFLIGMALYCIVKLIVAHRGDMKSEAAKSYIIKIIICGGVYALTYIPYIETLFGQAPIPVVTYGLIGLLWMFNKSFMKTVLGQNMRTVGQSMAVATASGINVNKTRVTAIVVSTICACMGQIILLQNLGTVQTYGAHTQVGMFAIAALLVGGASVNKASNSQALIGVILFHTLFIVSPIAGKNLFGSPQIGEYFRVFVAYGVIAVSLGLHAWQVISKAKSGNNLDRVPLPTPVKNKKTK